VLKPGNSVFRCAAFHRTSLGGAIFYDGGNCKAGWPNLDFERWLPSPTFQARPRGSSESNWSDDTGVQYNCINDSPLCPHHRFGLRSKTPGPHSTPPPPRSRCYQLNLPSFCEFRFRARHCNNFKVDRGQQAHDFLVFRSFSIWGRALVRGPAICGLVVPAMITSAGGNAGVTGNGARIVRELRTTSFYGATFARSAATSSSSTEIVNGSQILGGYRSWVCEPRRT